jgi:TolB-like protein
MKTKSFLFFFGFVLFAGCASTTIQDRQLTKEEMDTTDILGTVQTTFTVSDPTGMGVGVNEDEVKNKAYMALLQESSKKYTGNIDIRNINISRGKAKTLGPLPVRFSDEVTYTATGTVVSTYSSSQRTATRLSGITNQILDAFKGNQKTVTLAILDFANVDGKQSVLGRYLVEQTSNYLFRNSEIKIVERGQIEKVIKELDFNMSGYVSDESAVQIGHMLGANAVAVGTITRVGSKISVNIKIVETESAALLSSGSTEIEGEEYLEMYNELIK